jgi:arylsulfatase A-like enzyme
MASSDAGSMGRRLGSWLRAPATTMPNGTGAVGALYLFAVSALVSSGPLIDPKEPVLGTAAGVVANLVRSRFADEVTRIYVLLAAATVLAGVALAWLAAVLIAVRDRAKGGPPSSRARFAVTLVGLIAVEHFGLLSWSMTRHPQVYARAFYGAGGVRRGLELFVAGRLTPSVIAAIAIAAAASFILGPPTSWKRSTTSLIAWARSSRATRFALVLVALVTLVAGARALLAATDLPKRPEGGRLNVIVLASDGVRADRLRPDITPRLSELADRSTRFDRAYVTVPRTFSSWVTILTGRHAHHHGVRSTCESWEHRARSFDALPDRFAAAGYRTAVVSDFAGDIFGRAPLGFQDVHVPTNDFRQMLRNRGLERDIMLMPFLDTALGRAAFPSVDADESLTSPGRVADDAIHEIRRLGNGPFFLTVFFSATHFPYAAPYPFYRRFTDPAYEGAFKYGRPVGLSTGPKMSPDDVRQARALYDGAVASVDHAAGSILDELRRDHLDDRTILVVTTDHGENLFESRPEFAPLFGGHGEHLFGDESTHVPLVIFDPRSTSPHREAAVVSSVDIAPTLYELAEVPAPGDMDGRSLASAVKGRSLESAPAFAETELWLTDPFLPEALRIPNPPIAGLLTIDEAHGDEIVVRPDVVALTLVARHRMVRDERWKLVYMPTRAGVAYALFDTENDPGEVHDVLASHPAETQRLRATLWNWMLQDPGMSEQRGYLLPKLPATEGAQPEDHGARL